MKRVTITIEDDLLATLDSVMTASGATNRSEALRDILRRALANPAPMTADCMGVVSYTLDRGSRKLGQRVPQHRHDRHDAAVAALSVPLDHDSSLEVCVLRGRVAGVRSYAEGLFAERGVRHGHLVLVPVLHEMADHEHGGHRHRHSHLHVLESFPEPETGS